MADGTHIEWTDATWNPVTGCSVVSPGCANCYAMRLAGTRLRYHWSRQGLTRDGKAGPVWTGEVRFNEPWLDQPLRWSKPRRIFVAAHGDLFAEGVPDEWIDRVFAVMALCPRHTFQVLTKRAQRMREYFARDQLAEAWWEAGDRLYAGRDMPEPRSDEVYLATGEGDTPTALPNVWLGVSVEDQPRADERLPHVLALAERGWRTFASVEPLLGPVDLTRIEVIPDRYDAGGRYRCGIRVNALTGKHFESGVVACGYHLRWVIVGGESGPGARPMHPEWARRIRGDCVVADVPFFFKQWGEWAPGDHGKSEADDCALLNGNGISAYAARGTWPTELAPLVLMQRVGKRAAGRLLDGREWDEFP